MRLKSRNLQNTYLRFLPSVNTKFQFLSSIWWEGKDGTAVFQGQTFISPLLIDLGAIDLKKIFCVFGPSASSFLWIWTRIFSKMTTLRFFRSTPIWSGGTKFYRRLFNSESTISMNFIKIRDVFLIYLLTLGLSRPGLKLFLWSKTVWGSLWTPKEHFDGVRRWNREKSFSTYIISEPYPSAAPHQNWGITEFWPKVIPTHIYLIRHQIEPIDRNGAFLVSIEQSKWF